MVHFDASSAECLVFTFKEGMLSTFAHDLKIRVTTFAIDVDPRTRAIEASFDAASLRVVTAMHGEAESPGTLTAENRRQIEANITRDVLEARTHPDVRFVAAGVQEKGTRYVINGTLTLHGTARKINVRVHKDGDRYVAEARIHQPDFGIRPYSAMLGTLKVKADVTVRVSVPFGAPGQAWPF